MVILVCGSRNFKDCYAKVGQWARHLSIDDIVVHGGAEGPDRCAGYWAKRQGCTVLVYAVTPADWEQFGKRAGILRNERMFDAAKPDTVVAFWDGRSPGTRHMIGYATARGCPVEIIT